METETNNNLEAAEKNSVGMGLWSYGISISIIVLLVSLGLWYLLGDPTISALKLYPQPFGVFVFWGILVLAFLGFNGEMWGFTGMKQPLAGIVAVIVTAAIEIVILVFLNYIYGSMDPAFSPQAPGGLGWVASGMIVLYGFYFVPVLSNSMGHWPWTDLGLKQPAVGIIEIFVGLVFTIIAYAILLYPNLASWTAPDRVLMSLPVAVGWFYSVIIFWLTSVLLWENWPFSKLGSRAAVAIGSFFGNMLGGTLIYYILVPLLKGFLIPIEAQQKIGAGITLWPAQLGVCIVMLLLVWWLAFQNWPHNYGAFVNKLIRFVIVFGGGIIIFVIYTRWFGPAVLHEPAITAGFGGDPLNFFDLFNLILLAYMVFFGAWPLKLRK